MRANVCALEMANGERGGALLLALPADSVPPNLGSRDSEPCVFQWRTERQNADPMP